MADTHEQPAPLALNVAESGDVAGESFWTKLPDDPVRAERIRQLEAHYHDACVQLCRDLIVKQRLWKQVLWQGNCARIVEFIFVAVRKLFRTLSSTAYMLNCPFDFLYLQDILEAGQEPPTVNLPPVVPLDQFLGTVCGSTM